MSDLFETPNTTTASNDYSATSIEVLEGLEPVRHRPGMYIGGTDETALHHLVAEILDNSMDEAVAGYANKIEVQMNADYSVTITDNGRGIPVDPHPNIPEISLGSHYDDAALRRQVRRPGHIRFPAVCTASAFRLSMPCPKNSV